MTDKTYTPKQLLARVRKLPENMPISDCVPWSDHHDSHRHHWIKWLEQYETPGFYNRKQQSGRDCEYLWNHLQCGEMMVYLAEAAGIDPIVVARAARFAHFTKGQNRSARAKEVRKVLPWHLVQAALWPAPASPKG